MSSIAALKEVDSCQVVIMMSHLGLAYDMQLAATGYLSGVD